MRYVPVVSSQGVVVRRLRPDLVAGLLYLQHAFDLSDDDVMWGWVKGGAVLQWLARLDQNRFEFFIHGPAIYSAAL